MRASYDDMRNRRDQPRLRGWIVALACVLVLVPAMFGDLLPYSARNYMLLLGCAVSFCLFLGHRDFDLFRIGVGYGWLLFAMMAMTSRFLSGSSLSFTQVALPLATIVMCVSTCSTSWLKPGMRLAGAMLCIHLAATLLFYVRPTLYLQTVKPLFFSAERNAIGYQSGLTSHFSHNGFFMAEGFLLTASGALCSAGGSRRKRTVLALLFLIGLVLTQKRAHIVFAILALAVTYSVVGSRGKALKMVAVAIVMTMALLVAAHFVPGIALSLSRLAGTFDTADMAEATTGRTYLWKEAIRGWLERPFFGNGWGSYAYFWPGGNVSVYAHNELLQLLHDVGIVGALVFVWLTLASLILAFRNATRLTDRFGLQPDSLRAAACFSLSLEVFCLTYACTTGALFQLPLIFIPYLLVVGMSTALRSYLIDSEYEQ